MIKFYYTLGPNPMKVTLFLEEAGLPYNPIPVDVLKGEQHSPAFLAINPNGKTPAIVDGDVAVFDSNAILLYLAEKTGLFLGEKTPGMRGQLYSWLMFVATGIGPFSGQHVHFTRVSPEKLTYAVNRYEFETVRHWKILDAQLEKNHYMLGETYTIVDMAVWGWSRALTFVLGEDAWSKFPNVKRLFDEISARPAAVRADALSAKHAFKTDFDAEARKALFPHDASKA